MTDKWIIHHPEGKWRVVATKELVGTQWIEELVRRDCRVEVYTGEETFGETELLQAIGNKIHGALAQLSEPWNDRVLTRFAEAGGKVVSSYAVGVNNIDQEAATRLGVAVCNTPGVLTEATAELTMALVLAALRRVCEGERYMREGRFTGWLPYLMLGRQLTKKTVGLFGAGRIGQAFARMMAGGFGARILYYNPHPRPEFEYAIGELGRVQSELGMPACSIARVEDPDELFAQSDVLALLSSYSPALRHFVDARRLTLCRPDAVLVNASRGPVVDEAALIAHLKENPEFKAGLDVFEFEPELVEGLTDLPNVTLSPHTGSATLESRSDMAVLAAANCIGVLNRWPANVNVSTQKLCKPPLLSCVPSLLNAKGLQWPLSEEA